MFTIAWICYSIQRRKMVTQKDLENGEILRGLIDIFKEEQTLA